MLTSAPPRPRNGWKTDAEVGLDRNGPYQATLEPMTQHFVDTLTASGAFPFSARSAANVRTALANLQSRPIGKPDASIEDMTFPVGPKGAVRVRIVRPKNAAEAIPVVMFFHGGGWVAGDVDTHDRLIREIAIAVHAAVIFVAFSRHRKLNSPFPSKKPMRPRRMSWSMPSA